MPALLDPARVSQNCQTAARDVIATMCVFIALLDPAGAGAHWQAVTASRTGHQPHGDAERASHLPVHPTPRSSPAGSDGGWQAEAGRAVLP